MFQRPARLAAQAVPARPVARPVAVAVAALVTAIYTATVGIDEMKRVMGDDGGLCVMIQFDLYDF